MRRLGGCCAAVMLLVPLGSCAMVQSKDGDLSKPAVSLTAAGQVVSHYNRVRDRVDTKIDLAALGDIEGGDLLEIDRGLLYLRRELGVGATPMRLGSTPDVFVGGFDKYPLWFVVVAKLSKQDEQVAAVFVRATSTSPWLMTEAPRLAGSTELPLLASDDEGEVVRYDDTSSRWSDGEPTGLRATPQELVDSYATVLQQPGSPQRADFVEDSFLSQMWELSAAQPSRDVSFDQTWGARPVKHVLRLSDGGALVFATLTHTDDYQVERGKSLDFGGLEAAAYFPLPIEDRATLTYKHQVLLLVPAKGKPFVIGQHAGLIDATGS